MTQVIQGERKPTFLELLLLTAYVYYFPAGICNSGVGHFSIIIFFDIFVCAYHFVFFFSRGWFIKPAITRSTGLSGNCYVAEHFLKLELYHTNREFYFLKLFAGRIYLLVVLGDVFYLFLSNVSIALDRRERTKAPDGDDAPTLCAHTFTCVTLVPRARRGICANAYEQTTALPLLLKKYWNFRLYCRGCFE